MATTNEVIADLQAINVRIDGVTSAPTAQTASVNSVSMPRVHVHPGVATSTLLTHDGQYLVERSYLMYVLVRPVAQGRMPDTLPEVNDMMDAFTATYMALQSPRLPCGAEVATTLAGGVSDQGTNGVVNYAGVDYHGFVFQVLIRDRRGR